MTIPATSGRPFDQAARLVPSERIDKFASAPSDVSDPRTLSTFERRAVVALGVAMLSVSFVTFGALASLLVPLIELIKGLG